MAEGIRSGLGAQFGIATESEYGKYAAPKTFYRFVSESLAKTMNYIETQGLGGGLMVQSAALHRAVTSSVGGDLSMPLLESGMHPLFNLLHGEEVKIEKNKTAENEKAYDGTHEIGTTEPFGKSLTAQVYRPDTALGETGIFSYTGLKIPSLTISVNEGDTAMIAATFMGREESLKEALAEETLSESLPFTFQDVEVKAKGTKLANAKSVTLAIGVPQPERFLLGNTGLTEEPIINALMEVTASCELEFASLTDHERYLEQEVVELLIKGVGQEIDTKSKVKASIEMTITDAKQVSSAPVVSGPDIVTQPVDFKGLGGEKAPLSVKITSVDTKIE